MTCASLTLNFVGITYPFLKGFFSVRQLLSQISIFRQDVVAYVNYTLIEKMLLKEIVLIRITLFGFW